MRFLRRFPTRMKFGRRIVFSGLAVFLAGGSLVFCAEDEFSAAQIEFFEKEVRPVLAENCLECHSGVKAKVGLQLNSRSGWLRGSDYQKVVDLENPAESVVLKAINHTGPASMKMPKGGEKLSEEAISAIESWIAMKLPWPEEVAVDSAKDPRDHWSFQPVAKPDIPADFTGNPIDFFIEQKLASAGLEAAAKADRYTRYRRLTFDLLGLPPEFEEMQRFIDDPRSDEEVWSELVARLLDSPRYGERWARHWMDVARYADTKGYEVGGRERRFVHSYTYRDWLIRAMNEDLPYDDFLMYQLAAEQLVERDSPEKRHLAALGFITLSKNGKQELVIDDRLDTTFRGTMGLTVACARCHDHKFDPISTKEYYGLAGVFLNSVEPKTKPVIGEPKSGPEYENYLKDLAAEKKKLDDFLNPKLAKLAEQYPKLKGNRDGLLAKMDGESRKKLRNLQGKFDKFIADRGMEPDKALIIEDRPKPINQHVFIRGNPGRRGELAPRRFLSIISGEESPEFPNGSGRLDMAREIVDPNNPLTARVMVNRVWMWHFGEGIVRTVSDFGTQGEPPTHPELLDFLAAWFVENDWSLKKLHQLILESEVWQRSSIHPRQAEFAEIDPENFLLWKANRRRLDFEQMRDGMLKVTGHLSDEMFGHPVKILEKNAYSNRRSLYAFIDRQNLAPVFRNFDFSNPQETTGKRPSTAIPMQTLFALNNGFVQTHASKLAAAHQESEDRIGALHRAVFAAEPDDNHRTLTDSFLTSYRSEAESRGDAQTLTEWSYGWGRPDLAAKTVDFNPFTHWTGSKWQIEKEWPIPNDPRSYLGLSGDGAGHPGHDRDHSLIIRWQAPRDLTVNLSGVIRRPNQGKGDGVRGTVFVENRGVIHAATLLPDRTDLPMNVPAIALKKGEFLHLMIDAGEAGNCAFDTVNWQPELQNAANPSERWKFNDQFSGPANLASPLESYAQALLISNRFQFVD